MGGHLIHDAAFALAKKLCAATATPSGAEDPAARFRRVYETVREDLIALLERAERQRRALNPLAARSGESSDSPPIQEG